MSDNLTQKEGIKTAINRGIDYLFDHQLPNGEFLLYMSGDDAMLGWNIPEGAVFSTALIGNCLLPLRNKKKVKKIHTDTANFLLYQMDKGGTWNHHTLVNRFRKLCPQDLDDTACVSHFLKEVGFNVPAKKNQQLMFDNRRTDGLFYTWITFRLIPNRNILYWYHAAKELMHPIKSIMFWNKYECSRYDVDAGVNANILYYIGNSKETRPIISYLINIIKKNKETDCDKWYRNPLIIYYFISRNFYAGINEFKHIRSEIINRILATQKPNGCFRESVLDTALGVSCLVYLSYDGHEIAKAIQHIIDSQNKNGHWNRWALYYTGPKKESCYGSEELTTAFCLEALARYKNRVFSTQTT